MDRLPAERALAPRLNGPLDDTAPIVSDEDLARRINVNLLIMGADDAVARFVTSLWPHFLTPRVVRRRGERLRLGPTLRPVGTILVHDVQTLTHREQHALYRWLSVGNGRTRIVSTTTQSLVPLLATGAFNNDLYYRLNVLTLDLTSPVAH